MLHILGYTHIVLSDIDPLNTLMNMFCCRQICLVTRPYCTMGRYSGKTCRLLCMISLTLTFFLVEIVVGYVTNSLALIGDSYHMLSDVIALFVGFASVRVSVVQFISTNLAI